MIAPTVGEFVVHIPSATTRRVTGVREAVVHFSPVIKRNGETFYWASVEECASLGGAPLLSA